jgi:hypothetical protein
MAISIARLLSPRVATYRGVQVDKDGARHVLAAARLGEEGLERSALVELLRIGVGTAIG